MIDLLDPRIAGAPPPVITCTVNGVPMRLRHGHRISETNNGRTRFDGVIYSPDGTADRPPVGGDLQVVEDGVVTFGGIIDTPTESGVGGEPVSRLLTPISAMDYNGLAERRVMLYTFAPGTLKSWLAIIAPYLAHWGVTLDPAQEDGPLMPDALAVNFDRIDDVLNELSTLTNGDYLWEITYTKHLRMFAPATTPAPFDVVDGDRNTLGDVTVAPSITSYATRILLLFGDGLHDVTETFLSTGAASFPLGYWVAATRGYVTANPPGYSGPDVNEPIGATAPPYWTYDNAAATLTRTPAPVAGTAISFTYTAQFPTLVYADPPGGIPDPPGLWERLVKEPDVFDRAIAQAHANTYILQASQQTTTIKYRTLGRGVHPGQLQHISRSARHLNAQCLITDVTISDTDGRTYRDVTAVASTIPPGETWRDIIKSWGAAPSSASGSFAQITSGGGSGGGAAIGPGTIGHLAKWLTASTIGDSLIAESGTTITVSGDVVATSYTGSGAGLTNLPASALVGTIADARLSANVALKNAPLNAFTGNMTIGGTLGVTGATTLSSLGVTGNATVGGTFGVTGTTTLGVLNAGASTLASLGVTGNGTIGGTLSVTGNTTLGTLTTTGLANLAGLAVAGNATLGGNATVAGYIGSPSYTSQLTGWRITATGAVDVRYLYADELHTKAFIADLEQALAGGQIISKSVAKVANTANGGFRVGTDTQLIVESFAGFATASVFQNADVIRLRSFARTAGNLTVTDAYGTVALDTTYGAGGYDAPTMTQAYTFTKTSGTNILANTGTLALDYGVSGNGYYEVTAVDGTWGAAAPYAQVVTWSGSPSTLTCRTRLGNVSGVFGTAGEYGLFAGDYAGKRYLRASSAGVELHGLDLLLWDGTITTFKLDHTVPSFAMGNPAPTGYGTGKGTGMWMGKDTDGVYKFRVGTPGSAGMFWDGTSLTITGVSGGALTGIPAGGAASDVNTYSTTISGGKITTGSITGNKLLITAAGACLNADPTFEDLSLWGLYQGVRAAGAGGHGNYAVLSTSSGGSYCLLNSEYIPIDKLKVYRLSAWVWQSGTATGVFQMGIGEFDGNKTSLGNTYAISNLVPTTALQFYSFQIQPTFAATAYVYLFAVLNNGGTAGQHAIANFRLEEMAPSTLIQDGAITTSKIFANAVTAGQIAAGTITTTQIAANTITGGNIAAGTITAGNIAAGTITAAQIAAGSITGTQIAASTITGGNIAAGTITAGNLAAGTITAGQIAAGTITSTQIAARSITADRIVAHALTATEIQAGTITANEIAANSITADRLSVGSLSAISANLGTVTAGSITGGTINGATVYGGNGSIRLDSSGLNFLGSGGAAQINMNGALIQHFNGGVNGLGESNWISVQGGLFNNSDMSAGHDMVVSNNLTVNGTCNFGSVTASGNVSSHWFQQTQWPAGSNVAVHQISGYLYYSTSSLRDKDRVSPWAPTIRSAILHAQPILFDYVAPPKGSGQKDLLGFSAENLYDIDPHLVVLDDGGAPLAIRHDALFAHLLVALQDVTRRLTAIEGHA